MDASELEKYEYQLAQIKEALAKDPTNQEFVTLEEELTSLIDLTRDYLGLSAPAAAPKSAPAPKVSTSAPPSKASSSAPAARPSPAAASPRATHSFKAGDDCLARYSRDKKFYPARVTSVGGSDSNVVYSVVFSGYASTELVSADEIKPLDDRKGKRMAEMSESEMEKERKRKKAERKAETKTIKTAEQGARQQSWQSFAKKGAKKGVVIPGMAGSSMFRSPEDMRPDAKVGVVGSGKGMTAIPERRRQTFE